jgi:hypothetical protein
MYMLLTGSRLVHKFKNDMWDILKNSYDAIQWIAAVYVYSSVYIVTDNVPSTVPIVCSFQVSLVKLNV